MRSIPVEKSRYEGTNVPPPGAPQLEGIHLEVSSDPLEKLSKNVAPAGAAGALACNVPLTRKRVAKTKTTILIIKNPSFVRRWGLANQSLVGQRDCGARETVKFPIA